MHLDKEMGSLDACRAKLIADLKDKVSPPPPFGQRGSDYTVL